MSFETLHTTVGSLRSLANMQYVLAWLELHKSLPSDTKVDVTPTNVIITEHSKSVSITGVRDPFEELAKERR